ncbi:uncharacterized protein ACA1_090810 [Acanthamoeba castellanii str. Neff]|uniref:Uncharacterized protein n=1 Tax=Acanthamoeba castellanii (strain ATCC 30010 / Neff) TaxID=1257118 RepID=L8GI21_ACACF|nr:uncharacterized protein ACA1_090810 [Acanthamoeba castellanii str. Neff]ELR12592.1 hypothetical protein ACA1_090810 [Acanthamoeba castellanii str. Neff]
MALAAVGLEAVVVDLAPLRAGAIDDGPAKIRTPCRLVDVIERLVAAGRARRRKARGRRDAILVGSDARTQRIAGCRHRLTIFAHGRITQGLVLDLGAEQLTRRSGDVVGARAVVIEDALAVVAPRAPRVAAVVKVVHIERGAASELILGRWLDAETAPAGLAGAPPRSVGAAAVALCACRVARVTAVGARNARGHPTAHTL